MQQFFFLTKILLQLVFWVERLKESMKDLRNPQVIIKLTML